MCELQGDGQAAEYRPKGRIKQGVAEQVKQLLKMRSVEETASTNENNSQISGTY